MQKSSIFKKIFIGFSIMVLGISAFHGLHYLLYCRYRGISGKSHCGTCRHNHICQKYHHKKNLYDVKANNNKKDA